MTMALKRDSGIDKKLIFNFLLQWLLFGRQQQHNKTNFAAFAVSLLQRLKLEHSVGPSDADAMGRYAESTFCRYINLTSFSGLHYQFITQR
jgi:hypothetical protein